MWFREFKDYPIDTVLIKNKVEPSKGIVGCEMHDRMGWGNTIHRPRKSKKGVFALLLDYFFSGEKKSK